MLAGAAWWGWTLLATLIMRGDVGHAAAALRVPVVVMALGAWVFADGRVRARAFAGITLVFAWIALQCWQQEIFGHNIFGMPRYGDGALTGPFDRPKAGPNYVLSVFPAVVPWAERWGLSSRIGVKAASFALMAGAVGTAVMIGQRMPTLLMFLGVGLLVVLHRSLRAPVLAAMVAGVALIAALPVISPAAYHKLVLRFLEQTGHFSQSAYGQLYWHAVDLVRAHPVFGIGYNMFRDSCGAIDKHAPVRMTITQDVVQACNIHPHNFYLEAAVNGGVPALILFCAMVGAGIWVLARRVMRAGDDHARRIAVLVGVVIALWPIASTSSFISFPNLGWVMLMLGLGFAMEGVADSK